MDVHKFIVVMLTLSSLMAEQMDWGDNADLVEKIKYIEDRKNVKLLVVFEGEDIDLECQVFYTSEPVGNIVWKIDATEEETNKKPILSYEYGEVFIQSHLQMSNISRDRDGSTVSCNYAKGQYGGSVRAVLAVFMMQFCQAGGGDVRVVANEAGRDSPGETFVEDRIKDKIRNITGEHKVMTENGEYSVTVPYNSLIGNIKLTHLYPQLVKDGLDRIQLCDVATISTNTTTTTNTSSITMPSTTTIMTTSLTTTSTTATMTDGSWGEWEEWQSCSKSCLQEMETPGLRRRRRICIEPQNGGLPCKSSEEVDTEVCAGKGKGMRVCPLDYSFNEWSDWSGCSHNCGDGVSTRYRLCKKGRYGGLECPSLEEKEEKACFVQACTPQQITGCIMNDWGTWSACTKTCLDINDPIYGSRMRRRQYMESDPNHPQCVEGSEIIQIDRKCAGYGDQVHQCPNDASWSQWSEFTTCSELCGKRGNQRRYRSCIEGNGGGYSCSTLSEPTMEYISCYSGPCPRDCQWSNWGTWEQCERNNGKGNQIRRRNVFVFGKHGGIPCQQSDSFEQRECFVQAPKCRVEEWSEWSPAICPISAGQHYQTRDRSFISEDSKFTGYDCSKKEKDDETRLCQGCPAAWHYVITGDEHHCYRVLRDIPRNWIESRDACRQANGYLAEITSPAENDAVLKYLRDYEDVDCWIGLNDRETENQFEWSKSKTKLGGFSDWETIYSREPNNGVPHWGEEDCVFLYARALSVNRKWNDLNCKDNSEANIPLYALCEYDFEDFADCVYEDEFFRYCKVGVKPGTTMSEGSVAQTCREVGMEAVCSGNQRCKYSSSDCVVTPLSTKCFAPMYSLSKRICSGRQPRECPALKGVFSHMTGLSGGECGVVGNTWCAKGNDFTAQNNSHYFAYCAEEKG
eukprot:GFUD01031032.1.p1 GENE.GFUD01031032.1~~GFUD01031032.1.p1  ORF type:complete len:911 (-),score=155.86 GFUD01031032.1:100-2832(-)